MLHRREFLRFVAGASAALGAGSAVASTDDYVSDEQDGFVLPTRYHARRVYIQPGYTPGDIYIDNEAHFLYFVETADVARRYGIAVGQLGRQFRGSATVRRKVEWPRWTPTKNMIRREPHIYKQYAAGMPGGPGNPLGSRALYLYRGGRDTMFRIHGTIQPSTIGHAISNGCIRMINPHVEDLYARVPIGTRVTVLETA